MTVAMDTTRKSREWQAGGGPSGAPPISPILPGEWRPGMPCHWSEQTRFDYIRYRLLRLFGLLQLFAWLAYIHFRVYNTIAMYDRTRWVYFYQIFFLSIECLGIPSILFKICETWNGVNRNCVDFKRIPPSLLEQRFSHPAAKAVRPEHANYPSVAVLIPCYNEDVRLVQDTVLGALNIDYPRELLSVYLCDDGRDPAKRDMMAHLAERYSNVFYCTRPEHVHAKAGNLNYTLERTDDDLIVTLDADFVARPNLLQRLIPYYYVWNPVSGLYEFNESLAAVQTPQFFRNLSPYDNDLFDQRATNFVEVTLPGKDWFNSSTLVGTSNLLSRIALEQAKFYPYNSVTEDTGLTLVFHSLGFRTYFVNESLASGLATTDLWSNFNQRERWLKGDFQILFSSKGPFTIRGLSLMQRIHYFQMTFAKFLSISYLFYDMSFVLLICAGIPIMDVPDSRRFLMYIVVLMSLAACAKIIRTSSSRGTAKSESAGTIVESVFRYNCLRGLLTVLCKGRRIKFKVTDKPRAKDVEKEDIPGLKMVYKNIQKTFPNYITAALLLLSAWKAMVMPPTISGMHGVLTLPAVARTVEQHEIQPYSKTFPLLVAVAFAVANAIPHLIAVYFCFVPYTSRYELKDLIHGRCDQYAVDVASGRLFVPQSAASLVTFAQFVLVFGSIAVLIGF